MKKLGKDELFVKRVYDLVSELKLPIIDERVYDKSKLSSKKALAYVNFEFDEDESIIRGFLGLAEYFHTIIIKDDDEFYIPHDGMLFHLESS